MSRRWAVLACVCVALLAWALPARSETVLRVAPHSNLVVLDPIWTTAYITRNHGYMIYDTLFGTDAQGKVRPQMVDEWEVSRDRKVWTFRLREGLQFHDGTPVTGRDVIASLERWGKRDTMGIKLMSFVERIEAMDARTFRLRLREPYGLVLESLGKPSSNVPFIMPERVARTSPDRQIDDTTGSGPFVFKRDAWRPGERVVYLRNPKYVPRRDAPSGTAGAKIPKVDRVEWMIIKDPQTQANALIAGEIDLIEAPAHELYAQLRRDPGVQLVETNPLGFQAGLRFNHVQPPFDNVRIRRAAMAALNQLSFLRAQVGVPEMYRTCFSVYPCGSPFATQAGMDFIVRPDMKRAQQLLRESGYDGTPIVIMQPTDLAVIAKLPVVAAQLLRTAGFKVDLQAMDWQTLVARRAKKDPPSRGGWSIFCTIFAAVDMANPVVNQPVAAACDKSWFGWPCDESLEKLRDAFARTDDPAEQKRLAEAVQVRAMEIGTYVPLGEYVIPVAARKNVQGLVTGYFLVLWNVEKR
ncbi:MAG TPA: ABC transporter substrate-binding protein [Burkholderiales bacterium]|jgi:peptide/nickel transport system substrate-binding protein|nr:ABC transporter substrate-binding protein [Burkholderiales bacterium]